MKKLILIFALFTTVAVSAQEVDKTTVLYSVKGADSLRMDLYRAQGETLAPQPCMVFVFGGGFVWGTRDEARYLPFFEYMAQRGFTVAAIDYRLGLKQAQQAGTLDAETFSGAFTSTLVMAVEDLYDATSYILSNAEAWSIDPAKIVTCGSSAGAITVLMGEYHLCRGTTLAQKLPQGFNYAGVISFAGAIFSMGDNLNWGSAQKPAPMLLFHGDADRNVPYGAIRAMGAGFFGSEYIAEQMSQMHIPHEFYSVTNAGHEMADLPMNGNRYEIDSFLEKLVFMQQPLMIRTDVKALNLPDVSKEFTLMDYVQQNFGK